MGANSLEQIVANSIEIITGEATASLARLYVRLRDDEQEIASMSGSLTGPHCHYSRTLQASFPVRSLDAGPGILAEILVPDPCFWTPDMPFLYQLDLEINDRRGTTQQVSRLVGIRHWGTDGVNLRLDGRRTVLRGVTVSHESALQNATVHKLLTEAHEANVTLAVRQTDDAFCEEASKLGVAVIAELRDVHDAEQSLLKLHRWPAVMVAVLSSDSAKRQPFDRSRFPNLLLAQATDSEKPIQPEEVAPWADCIALFFGRSSLDKAALSIAECHWGMPVIALRPNSVYAEIASIRSACDQLQAELAPQLDLAGYFV